MANLRKWSTTATGNATVAGGVSTINFAEGQTPGSVNNSAREMMAQVRSIYTPSEWGWVEHSSTASVATQTTFKLAGNQTTNWTAGRRWRLKSGSTTRYGSIVSSSFTVETTVTVTVDSGSLSASHSLAAISPIDNVSNQVPVIRTDTAGRLGIGTAPLYLFDVLSAGSGVTARIANGSSGGSPNTSFGDLTIESGDANMGAQLLGTNTTTQKILFGDVAATDSGQIEYSHSSDAMSIYTAATKRMTVDSSGNVLGVSGAIGYGTGAGGAVTQITSKATGVTLNKPCGQITMNNAALAASASVEFQVSNTFCTTSDTVILNVSTNSFTGYRIELVNAGTGLFNVRVTNVTAGSLSQAVVVNFAIIKSVAA